MTFFNFYGLVFMIVIMIPNIIYAMKHKDKFKNKSQWKNSKFKKTENSFFLSYLLRFCGKIWHEMIGYFWYMYFYICTHIYRYTETFISFVMPINMFYWKIFMIVIISVILLTHKILFLNPWILLYCMGNLWTPTNHSQ